MSNSYYAAAFKRGWNARKVREACPYTSGWLISAWRAGFAACEAFLAEGVSHV